MKSLLFIMALLLPFITIADAGRPYIYNEIGGGGGNYGHIKFGVNALIAEGHTVGLACYINFRDSPDMPSGYKPGFRLFGDEGDVQEIVVYGVANYGRMFVMNDDCRFNLRGGLVGGSYKHPVNFERYTGGYFSASHTYDMKDELLIGIIANPSLELTLTRGWGFAIGPHVCINTQRQVFGLEINTIFGRLRHRRSQQ